MNCKCVDKINEKLKEQHETAYLRCTFGGFPVMYYDYHEVTKTGKKRNKDGIFIPSYCPFCGKKYE